MSAFTDARDNVTAGLKKAGSWISSAAVGAWTALSSGGKIGVICTVCGFVLGYWAGHK
jgi:hypothetical protein